MSAPPWLPIAEKYVGFHEIGNNQGIERFISLAHTGEPGDPWCAIFVNACLEEAGYRGSRSPAARSFETNSNFVRINQPVVGCIVTRWRQSLESGLGHVYFYLGAAPNGKFMALAGNEDDAVREYEEDPSKVTGFWLPRAYADSAASVDVPLFTVTGRMSVFGGPDDRGSGDPQEGLALFPNVASMQMHGLGDYLLPANGHGLFRRLNPEKFYVACRWDYSATPVAMLRDAVAIVEANGRQAAARPVDWGPNIRTGRVADLSPALANQLLLKTDDVCTVTIKSARDVPGPMPAPSPVPEPPLMPSPPATSSPMDYDQLAEAIIRGVEARKERTEPQRKSMWTAVITAALKTLFTAAGAAQVGTWGTVAMQVLAWLGTIAPLPGTAAPGATTTAVTGLAGLLVSGLIQMVNRVTQPKQEPKT